MGLSGITTLENHANRFSSSIPKTPTGRFASIILLRETKSYATFTTEGGEQQDVEVTQAGLAHGKRIDRLVLFKRKQVAPERRTGKALLRQYGCFPFAIVSREGEGNDVIYGVEAIAKAQEEAKGKKNLKVSKDHTSGTITEFDYTMPEVFLPAIVTTVDLTLDEFIYVLDNVLRTTRYGKESSRQGFIRNHVVAIALSDLELFSNLEFSQAFYDAFRGDTNIQLESGLSLQDFQSHAPRVIRQLTENLNGRLTLISGEELQTVLSQVQALNQDEHRLADFLKELNRQAASFSA